MPNNRALRPLTQSARFRRGFYRQRRWRALRALKLRSVGYRCEGCGRMGCRLEVHHIVFVGEHSAESELFPDLDGLRCLCYECHRRQHRKPSPVRGRDEWARFLKT